MKFSVRTRILAAYGVLVVLFLGILFLTFSQLQGIGRRLDLIEKGYLPLIKTVNALLNYSHLDENLDVPKLIENQSNEMFINSVGIHNPILVEQQLRKEMNQAKGNLALADNAPEMKSLSRIEELMDDLIKHHKEYSLIIKAVLSNIQNEEAEVALSQNEELLNKKRIVRGRISFLARQLDDRMQQSIVTTKHKERNALLSILAFSIGTMVIAILIGLFAIFSLKPLAQLKKAAQEIAAGELHRRVEIKTKDEVGELAQEFNRMADSIQERDEALRKQQEQLLQNEKLAVVGRMASKISHEIRNPLNSLGLNIEMLEDEMASETSKNTLKAMSTEIDRLNRIAVNYLNMAKAPVSGKKGEVSLDELMNHVKTLVGRECERKKVELEITAEKDLPTLNLDSARFEQAILNLLRNSMEAMKDGGKIHVRIHRSDGGVQFDIEDTGPGIPEDVKEQIFEPFFTTKSQGTGLGLSITHEIIKEQGGTIECVSEAGKGTRFSMRLPA